MNRGHLLGGKLLMSASYPDALLLLSLEQAGEDLPPRQLG